MKKLTNKNLDVYIFLKEFEKEHKYCPNYKEIQENTNYKSVGSVKQSIDKLEELGMVKTLRDSNGNIVTRTIRVVDDEKTKNLIEELRKEFK